MFSSMEANYILSVLIVRTLLIAHCATCYWRIHCTECYLVTLYAAYYGIAHCA